MNDLDAFPLGTVFAVFCDLDGTLCDCEHRRHHVTSKPSNWAAFFGGMSQDPIVPAVAFTYQSLQSSGLTGFLLTGRYEKHRKATELWLAKHHVSYKRLLMRPNGDSRPDTVVKREMLHALKAEGIVPRVALDDRDSVVAMWREEGITCLQVAPGDF